MHILAVLSIDFFAKLVYSNIHNKSQKKNKSGTATGRTRTETKKRGAKNELFRSKKRQ